ncbi:MAG: PQQ-binding-like beta-propeller repeat protein [Candidatus Polarisedimenticolia bacterium]
MRTLTTVCGYVLVLSLAPLVYGTETREWSQFRGPDSAGPLFAGTVPQGKFGLQVAWTRDLGSGYSNVWLAPGKAVTMHTDGAVDVVAAFDPATGKPLWRHELGPKYAGHDGSDDGPLGTPTVSDGIVYALGPRGQLVALSLADGSVKWQHVLDAQNSTVPHYGYTSSPLVLGRQVIVATGGDGHAATSFDRETGKALWASGEDSVSYQTPVLAELGGRRQLILVTDRFLQGLDPDGGKVLWKLRHTEGNETEQSGHPTVIDGERFLVKFSQGSRMYRYADGVVKELWTTRAFGNTFALPVLVGKHLYGFTGALLTCASAETGEIVWRSREVGSFGLSLVGGLLAIATRTGELLLVEPSPESYREVTRVPVLKNGNYAVPTFADGLFLVRNLQQVAAVRVDAAVAPKVAQPATADRLRGEFGKWIASVEKMPETRRQAAVDQRLAKVKVTPLVEEQNLAHVVWKGKAKDVGIEGDMVPDGQEVGLHALPGTDLFFRTFELDPKGQYTYGLIVDYADPAPDPRNPLSVNNGRAVASELRMPGWPASPHIEAPAAGAPRGTLDKFQFRSLILNNTREVQVWTPPEYARDNTRRYPVLVGNHGDNLVRGGLMQNTLDNLVGRTVEPLIAVFVPRVAGPEYGGPDAEAYTRFLVEELMPHIDRHYRTDPGRRAIMGPGSAGVAAVVAAFLRPDVFQQAAAQSFYPIAPMKERLPGLIGGSGAKPGLIHVVYSSHDYDFGDGRRAREASVELLGQLRAAKVKVVEQVADYSPGWAGWRGQDDEILATLFPLPKATK